MSIYLERLIYRLDESYNPHTLEFIEKELEKYPNVRNFYEDKLERIRKSEKKTLVHPQLSWDEKQIKNRSHEISVLKGSIASEKHSLSQLKENNKLLLNKVHETGQSPSALHRSHHSSSSSSSSVLSSTHQKSGTGLNENRSPINNQSSIEADRQLLLSSSSPASNSPKHPTNEKMGLNHKDSRTEENMLLKNEENNSLTTKTIITNRFSKERVETPSHRQERNAYQNFEPPSPQSVLGSPQKDALALESRKQEDLSEDLLLLTSKLKSNAMAFQDKLAKDMDVVQSTENLLENNVQDIKGLGNRLKQTSLRNQGLFWITCIGMLLVILVFMMTFIFMRIF